MRCDDVIRALVAPTDAAHKAALVDHLNQCSSCAAWAKRATQLDHLWQVTQPAEPISEAWDNVWTQVVSSLDALTVSNFQLPTSADRWNGAANGSPRRFEARSAEHPRARSFSF